MEQSWDIDDVTIRAERPEDEAGIDEVVTNAFPTPAEARLVALLRASESFVPEWSLVAELGGRVVGHVMVTFATLKDETTERRIASLAPLAVAPDCQARGIGSALVEAVTARVDEAGQPLIVLEGDPAYYGHLGFEYSGPLGIEMTLPDWAPPEAAQVRRLAAYDPSFRGRVVYPPAFEAVSEH